MLLASDAAEAVVRRVLAAACLAMAAIIGVQVVARYGFNHSLFWSEELGRALLVWLTFLGASSACKHGLHVGVDALVLRLGPGLRLACEVLAVLSGLFLSGLMLWAGSEYAAFLGSQQTAALGLPKAVIFAAIPVSGGLLTLHGLARLAALFEDSAP